MKREKRKSLLLMLPLVVVASVGCQLLYPDFSVTTESPELVWVQISGGTFEMGCSPGDTSCSNDEKPPHPVTVSTFEMTETEVTQAQFEFKMGTHDNYHDGCPNCPVEQVTWTEAKQFCESIGGRLPTEAEWEFAGRGGTETRYYCGDDPSCLGNIAWYDSNSGGNTNPVRQKTPNDFGLYDMLGNVWEWVDDCWHENYNGAPSTGEVWGGGDCQYRVLRGGSWDCYDSLLRASNRNRYFPGTWYGDYGFRCAR